MKAVFSQVFHWSRPQSSVGFVAFPSPDPQTFPHDFIEAAIAVGAATAAPDRKQPALTPDQP
jgi:hypothetical protein